MANESSLYYIGFEDAVGDEAIQNGMCGGSVFGCMGGSAGDRRCGNDMYRNVYVYSRKDDSECMVLPFYFIMGKHDYLWNESGDRLLLSACYGFYELGVDILPEKYAKWQPVIAVVNVGEKQIVKVYEGNAALCWNNVESDVMSSSGLKEFSYGEWSARYEAQREEVEKLVGELESDYTKTFFAPRYNINRRTVMGDVIDEVVEEKVWSKFSEDKIGSEEYEKTLKSSQRKYYIIAIVVLVGFALLLLLFKSLL